MTSGKGPLTLILHVILFRNNFQKEIECSVQALLSTEPGDKRNAQTFPQCSDLGRITFRAKPGALKAGFTQVHAARRLLAPFAK